MSELSGFRRLVYSGWNTMRRTGLLTKLLSNTFTRSILERVYEVVRPKGIVEKEIQGSHMRLNTAYRGVVNHLLYEGVYEPVETAHFVSRLRPGMVVVDVGANIGYYTLLAAKAVGSTGKVFAFEAEPKNYTMLTDNIRLNDYRHVVAENAAVSDTTGTLTIYFDEHVRVKSSLSRQNVDVEQKASSVEVPALRLDDYLAEKGVIQVDLLKVDVEGAEALVLAGAEGILRQENVCIFMEFWAEGLVNMGADPARLLESLQDKGFKLFRIDETTETVQPITIEEALSSGERWNSNIVNLFLEK